MLAFPSPDKLLLFQIETPDGKRLRVGSPRQDAVLRIYELQVPDRQKRLQEITDFNWDIDWPRTPIDGRFIALVGYRGDAKNKSRVVKVIDTSNGKEIWSGFESAPVPQGERIALNLDRRGRYLSIIKAGGEQGTLVEMPSGKLLGPVEPSHHEAWSPVMSYWICSYHETSHGKLGLTRRGETEPLVVLDLDVQHSGFTQFNAAGTLFAWGNVDGTVNVCDIPEVQRRLAAVGLGW